MRASLPESANRAMCFLDRIEAFPDGTLVLRQGAGLARSCAGYLSSEIWNEVPARLP